MSDIVERLRCLPSGWLEHLQAENTVLEAAAEIERLRGLLRDVDDGLGDYWVTTKEGADWICRRSKALGE